MLPVASRLIEIENNRKEIKNQNVNSKITNKIGKI
jgi:hypothetical protein